MRHMAVCSAARELGCALPEGFGLPNALASGSATCSLAVLTKLFHARHGRRGPCPAPDAGPGSGMPHGNDGPASEAVSAREDRTFLAWVRIFL